MIRRRASSLWQSLLALALLLATASSGLAHRLPERGAEAWAVYLLQGGSFTDLCGHDGEGHGAGGDCWACRIGADAILPERSAATAPSQAHRASLSLDHIRLSVTRPRPRNNLSRAPPSA